MHQQLGIFSRSWGSEREIPNCVDFSRLSLCRVEIEGRIRKEKKRKPRVVLALAHHSQLAMQGISRRDFTSDNASSVINRHVHTSRCLLAISMCAE